MHFTQAFSLVSLYSILGAHGSPTLSKRGSALPDDFANHPYIAPVDGEVRSPCPGLNTLANHGYLPRNGKGITRNDLSRAFEQGWGIDETVIDLPTENAFAVCDFRSGDHKGACGPAFDLDMLSTPDTFEHDHSMSRGDSRRNFSPTDQDNYTFNRTVFGDTLGVFGDRGLGTITDLEEVRLVREHLAFTRDPFDTFKENRLTMLTEMGFVFAVMRNFESARQGVPVQSSNDNNDQTIQLDWWMYWFSREQFPVDLGWRKPVPAVKNPYVTQIVSDVFAANPSSTPRPLPSDALKSPTTVPVVTLHPRAATPTIDNGLVGVTGLGGILSVPSSLISEAYSIVQTLAPEPSALAPYNVKYDVTDIIAYKSSLTKYRSSLDSVVTSLATAGGILALPTP